MLLKLEHYGIRGTALKWFKSYLSDRKQFVFINGASSEWLDITCGVPQGSVLGPLLFLIYINDLPNISNTLDFSLFADDTNIYHEAESPEKLESDLNRGLKELHCWLIVNRLSLNIEKTNFVIFHPYNKKSKYNVTLKIQKKALQEKSDVKYLGIMIDSGLTWNSHINTISKKIARSIGILYKIRNIVNIDILKILYYSLIHSHLNYAIEAWGSADLTHLNILLTQQKRAMRMITLNDKRLDDYSFPPCNPLFNKLKVLKVQDLFKVRICKFIFNSLSKSNPSNFHNWFKLTSEIHHHNTRSKSVNIDYNTHTRSIFIPTARTSHYGLKKTKVLGAKIWNDLPPPIRVEELSVNVFIERLKEFYLLSYISCS